MYKITNTAGFTLIEALIYIALMAIMIGGGLVGVYNIIEGSERTRSAMYREQEAFFITRKIDTLLSNAASVQSPTVGSPGTTLEVTTAGGEDVHVILEDDQIKLLRDGDKEPLHDTFVGASNLVTETDGETINVQFDFDAVTYQINHYLP